MHPTANNDPDKAHQPNKVPNKVPNHHDADGAEEWRHLRGNVRHQTVGMIEEIFALLRILLQDAIILVVGFAVEFVFEHWMHSDQPAFRVALNISSGFFLLLYGVMVTVHFVRYFREQFGTISPGTAGSTGATSVAGLAAAPATERARRGRYVAVGIAAAVAVAIAIGGGMYLLRSGSGGNGAGNSDEPINTLAVLALENTSGDPDNEYLGDGIAESLISSLSQVPELKVTSRDSAARFKGKEVEANVIGQQLGVRAVFKGQVRQVGDSLMVSVELIDANDNHQIWGQQYLRKATDIFALQQEIARDISDKLKLKLSGENQQKLAKRGTQNPEAYEAYLKGRFWWNKRNEDGFKKAAEYFQQAIEKDPNYALAYAGLADAYFIPESFGLVSPADAFPKAKATAMKALELDDTLAEAHASLGLIKMIYDRDYSGAEKEFQRAIELDPTYATAHHWYSLLLIDALGRNDDGLTQIKRAVALDPLSLIINRNLGQDLAFVRQYDAAIDQLRKTIEMDPSFVPAHWALADTYAAKKMYPEAIAEAERAVSLFEGPFELSILGYSYGIAGRKQDAQKILDRLREMARQRYVPAYSYAIVYLALRDKDQAFQWLDKAVEERSSLVVYFLKAEPMFDPLRNDPRYHDLLRRMNLE